MHMIALGKTLFAALALGLAVSAIAELERQHGVHVHGEAVGNLALDGGQLQIELTIPGANLVGFEHPPRTNEQRASIDQVLPLLESGDWLRTDARAECQSAQFEVHAHGFAESEVGDLDHHNYKPHQDHEGHHKHQHDHHDDQHDHHHNSHHHHDDGHAHEKRHEHAEFQVVARLTCQAPTRLSWIELNLFENYPGNGQITLDVLTDTVATRVRLSPGRERADLVQR
jgi:hypothetical protein